MHYLVLSDYSLELCEQVSYRLDNRKRDRLHGKPAPDAKVDTHAFADKAPQFRYVP
jgi:hypothetical protein